MKEPFISLVNGGSGSKDADTVIQALQTHIPKERLGTIHLLNSEVDFSDTVTNAVEECRRLGGILVVSGGDGTISSVLPKAVSAQVPIGIIPQGTFNFFARERGIYLEVDAAVQSLLDGEAKPQSLCWVNDKPFIISVSVGLYPKVIAARERHQQVTGRSRLVSIISGIVTLLQEPYTMPIEIKVDGKQRQIITSLLLVNANRLQLESLNLREAECLDQGKMAVLQLRPISRWRMLTLILQGALGQLQSAEHLDTYCAQVIEMRYHRKHVKVAIDGELHNLRTPLQIRIQPDAFRCILPRQMEPDA